MYARVFTTTTPPGKVEELTKTWQSMVLPQLQQATGFKGALVMGERISGKGLAITLWETQADALARDSSGESERLGALLEHYFTEPPTMEIYEVEVQV
jgi:heme-degrading monooxygenase HmoA